MVAIFATTVVNNWESKWPDLWSKWPIFNKLVLTSKVLPYSSHQSSTLPLTWALKWGTAWTFTSTGTGVMKGQNWRHVFYQVNLELLSLICHNSCASEIEVHKAPHFKGPVNGKLDPRQLECGTTFDIHTKFLKICHLLHKSNHFDSQLLTIVNCQNSQFFWNHPK